MSGKIKRRRLEVGLASLASAFERVLVRFPLQKQSLTRLKAHELAVSQRFDIRKQLWCFVVSDFFL